MYQCLVSIHHLFQVNGLVAIVGEGSICIEILVGLDDILNRGWCFDDGCTENAAGEITTIGDEVDVSIQITLYLFQALADLCDMLMLKRLVDAEVVVAP